MKTENGITFRMHTFIFRNKSHSYEKLTINASHRIVQMLLIRNIFFINFSLIPNLFLNINTSIRNVISFFIFLYILNMKFFLLY